MCLGFDFEIFFFLLQESHRVWGRGAATAPFKWPVPRYFGTWPKNKASQQRNLLPLPVLSALQAVKLLRLIIPANESLTVFTLHTHHALSLSLFSFLSSGVALGGPNTRNFQFQLLLSLVEKFTQILFQRKLYVTINSPDSSSSGLKI